MPVVTLIVPFYNAEKYIGTCLDSIISQTFTDFEAILVDDGSTDGGPLIAKQYATVDYRIQLMHQLNSGPSAARNLALEHAKGQYVALIDSDDWISADYLEKAVNRIRETGADAVVNQMIELDALGNRIVRRSKGIDISTDIITGKEALIRSITWDIHSWLLWNRNLYKNVRYDTDGMHGDEYTARELMATCRTIAFADGQYFYRYTPTSITKKPSVFRFDIARTMVKLKQLLVSHDAYNDSIQVFEIRQLNALKHLHYYYFRYRSQFSKPDCDIAKEKMIGLFHNLNKPFLRKMYMRKGVVAGICFYIKTLAPSIFYYVSYIIFRLNLNVTKK